MKIINSSTRSHHADNFCLIEIADQTAAAIDGGAMIGVAAEINLTSDSSFSWTITKSSSTSTPAGESISGIGFAATSGVNPTTNVSILGVDNDGSTVEHFRRRLFGSKLGGHQGIHRRYRPA
jgi:hypothetical protein